MITDSSCTTPWALIDSFLWTCWDRLFSRFPLISALRAAHSGLSGKHRHVPPLITDKLSLLVNCRVKLTGMSREDCAGSTTLALKLGRSAPSSRPFRLAACVLGTEAKILCWHMHINQTSILIIRFSDIWYDKRSLLDYIVTYILEQKQ